MRNKFFKICSIILVATLLVNMLPMSVFAEKFQANLTDRGSAAPEVETAVTENTYVVDDLEEKRTEFSKEFLLSNGRQRSRDLGKATTGHRNSSEEFVPLSYGITFYGFFVALLLRMTKEDR